MVLLKIVDNEDFNTQYDLCKQCGGKCCQRNACDCSPKDFDNSIEKMREALNTGNYTIDFSREDANSFICKDGKVILDTEKVKSNPIEFFYIRPKNINRPIVDIIHREEIEGPCIFWNKENGCPLTYKRRPMGGRTMVPFPGRNCISQYHKPIMLQEWKKFQDQLIELAKEFFDGEWIIYKQFNFSIK